MNSRTSKTIRYIEDTFGPPTTQKHTNHSFLVTNFTHPIEMVHHGEQHQRMNNHFIYQDIDRRHFFQGQLDFFRLNSRII